MKDDNHTNAKRLGLAITLPFALVIPLALGWFLGRYLDEFFQSAPVCMYSLMALGFIAGIREGYRMIKEFGENESD